MVALKEFVNFMTQNKTNLAATYAELLAMRGGGYESFSSEKRMVAARKLLNAVIASFEIKATTPLAEIFTPTTDDDQPRWPDSINPPDPWTEIECLGQTLSPVVTNLEAGKFLWQILAEVRATLHSSQQQINAPSSNLTSMAAPTYIGIQNDITERQRYQESLNESQQLLQLIMDNIPQTAFWKDRDSVYLGCNRAFADDAGLSKPEDIIGKTDYDMPWTKAESDAYREADRQVMESNEVQLHIIETQLRADGKLTWLDTNKIPLHDIEGNVIGILGTYEDITERREFEATLAKRAVELALVAQVSQQAATSHDPGQMLQDVSDMTKERFGLYHAHIYLLNAGGDRLDLTAGAGEAGRQMITQGWSIPFDREDSLVAQAARTRQGVIVNDVRQNPGFLPNPLLPETRAEMAVPMVAGDKLIGVLDVQADTIGRFSDDDVQIQSTLAAQIAVALANSRLLNETQINVIKTERQARRLALLNELAARLNKVDHLTEILDIIAQNANQLFDCERASVALFTAEGDELEVYALRGVEGALALGAQIPVHKTAAGLAALENRLVLSHNLAESEYEDLIELAKQGLQTIMNAPLAASGKVIGTINLASKRPHAFDSDDEALLQQTASLLATSIENKRLLHNVELKAQREQTIREITDKMRSAVNLEQLVKITAQELGQQFSAEYALIDLGIAGAKTHSDPLVNHYE